MANFVPTHVETNNNRSGVGSIQVNAPIIGGTSAPETERTRVRNELLARIGPPDVELRFAPGTCEWILKNDKFKSWRASSVQNLLWISGRPGKGKSHLAAFLGEKLSRRTAESQGSPLVLKFACKNTDIRRSTSLAVHLGVLHQILRFCRSDVALHDDAASILNDTHTSLNTNLPRDDLWGIIKGFANREIEGRDHLTYFILDGLDECDAESIEDLSMKLQRLCSTDSREGRPHFKAIILSRPLANISNRDLWVDLDDDGKYGEQILHEIRLFIDDEMRPILETRQAELDMLKQRLSERSNRTFLWVSLALKLLKSHRNDLEAIITGRGQDALDRLLPVGLPSMYNRMLLEALRGKYDTQGKVDAKSYAKIIQFICVAFRPLTLAEMQVAADTSNVSTIISNCRHILVESKEDTTEEDAVEEDAAQEKARHLFPSGVSWVKSSPKAKCHRHQQEADECTERKADEKTFQLVHLSLKQYLQQPPQLTIPTPLGLLLWSPLSLTVDTLRTMMHKFYYFDHILFVAILLSLSGLFKRHPAIGLVLVTLLAPQLSRRWMQKRSWVLQTLLWVFGNLLGRCVYGIFAASERRSHRELFLRSVAFLMDKKDGLQREKDANLSRPGALSARKPMSVDDELASFGHYACRFWVDHLFTLNGVNRTKQEEALCGKWVLQFLGSHLLDWLRNLSLQTKLRDGIISIKRLIQIFENRDAETRQLELLLKDAERFMMQFAPIIERTPFQIYAAALAFCPNNSIVRSTYWDRVLPWAEKIRTTQDDWSSVLQVLEGHTRSVKSLAFSNDGKLIASAAVDGTIHLWDAETGEMKKVLKVAGDYFICIAFSRHGNLVTSSMAFPVDARRNTLLQIWDEHTGNLINSIELGNHLICGIACSPDNDALAVIVMGEDSIHLWDLETCSFLAQISCEDTISITSMTFYPDGTLVVLTLGRISIWSIGMGKSKCVIKPHIEPKSHINDQSWCRERMAQLDSLVLSVKGQVASQGPNHHSVHRWDSKTGKPHAVPFQHSWQMDSLAFSPTRTLVASVDSSGYRIRLWDPTKSSLPPERPLNLENSYDSVKSMIISSDKKTLVTVSSSNRVKLWNLQAGVLIPRHVHLPFISTVALSPGGDLLAYSVPSFESTGGGVGIWSVANSEEAHFLVGHEEDVIAIGFSPDGHTLASFSDDCVRLWNPEDGTSRNVLKLMGSSLFRPDPDFLRESPLFAFSPDSMSIAFATGSKSSAEIKIWSFTSAEGSGNLVSLADSVVPLSFSCDGKKIASLSKNKTIVQVWDTETGHVLTKLHIRYQWTAALILSLDNSQLISSSLGTALQVWDLSKEAVKEAYKFTGPFLKLALSDCGTYLRTDRGVIDLHRRGSQCEIFVDGEWIVRGQERVLWLPHDMRADHAVLVNNLLILGCISGDVKLVQF